ncbi:high-affinity fructose transporter ght6 [Aspergillus udagawae]|nr:high-affinity fructose transporter ght6 [Aspergillus udagawae]
MTKDPRTFKVLLVGNSGVGKTAFLHRYLNKRFEHSLPVTANVEKHVIHLHTIDGPVRYEIWDVNGTQKPSTLASREFDEIDAAIIMFDLTDRISYNNVPNWYQSLVNKDGMRLGRFMPICICGNKNDASEYAKLPPKAITFPKKKGTGYVEMSVMDLDNIHEPFLDLARQLLRDPVLWYKSLPEVGPAVLASQTVNQRWSQENGSQDPKYAIGPRVQTKEMPPPETETQPATVTDISAENPPTVIESPKKGIASNGQLKFISTTNKAQIGIKSPANGTVSVSSETKSAVNQTVPVVEEEKPKFPIVPTEEHQVTKHHEPRKEPREPKKVLEPPEKQSTLAKDQSLFVLCIQCIRMILIKCIQGTSLAQLSNGNPCFALVTTACRSCCHDSKKPQSNEVRMSPDLIRYTAMYECARKVAEDDVEVLANKKTVAHISLDKLTDGIGPECQILGISTSSETLQRLRQVGRKDVLLGYVPGAFL